MDTCQNLTSKFLKNQTELQQLSMNRRFYKDQLIKKFWDLCFYIIYDGQKAYIIPIHLANRSV